MKKTEISIIIVNYRVKKELFECISSILHSETKASFEIIVVDNDENIKIAKELKKIIPKVLYVKSKGNIGFGAGNNLGAKHSKGKFLFFLNPDTKVYSETIDVLAEFLQKNKNTGIVAPLLINSKGNLYALQGTLTLTPLRGIFALSFLNKWFPENPISKKYWLLDWDKKGVKEVDVVPGTAFIIRRSIFEKIGGFDERFFLFFEENDLCKRVKRLGYKIFINPKSRVIHLWGKSTSQFKETKTIFAKSRFKYFQKHHGVIWAVLVESFLGINKLNLLLSVILILALFLRLYRLSELMPFIGDQGWFYLSARDMLLTGNIPLVGPETSHPWIHHGPLWTYLLAIILWIFHSNPIPPAYFVAFLGVITVWLMYRVSADLFSKNVGLIGAALYATSPLIVLNSRMPYHTSLIPFFTLLLIYLVSKWIKGNIYFVPVIAFLIGVLYNHELTTFILFIPIFILVTYGFWRKKKWAIGILNKKIIFYPLFAFLIPMLPFVIYDINHGYKQTAGFLVWLFYRIIKFPLNVLQPHDLSLSLLQQQSLESLTYLQRLIFEPNLWISLLILITSVIYLFYLVLRTCLKSSCFPSLSLRTSPQTGAAISKCMRLLRCFAPRNDKWRLLGIILLFLYLIIPIFGLFVHRIPIEADVLLISPFIIMVIAVFFNKLFSLSLGRIIVISMIGIVGAFNSYYLLSTEYLTKMDKDSRLTFEERVIAVDSAIKLAQGRNFNIVGKGELSFFPAFTMPYEYLLWWKGYPPKKENVDLKIVVWEKDGNIIVYEQK